MSACSVVVVRTGAANTASVAAALRRLGAAVAVHTEKAEVERAEILVLPGVGAFGPVARRLDRLGLADVLRRRVRAGRPTLAICLGLQLLATGSEESPGAGGLGVLPATVSRFPTTVRAPQLGWNRVRARPGCRVLDGGVAYFANSYRIERVPKGWHGAVAEHGGPFVAAVERGPVLGCQFHPELSGQWGHELLERWLAVSRGRSW